MTKAECYEYRSRLHRLLLKCIKQRNSNWLYINIVTTCVRVNAWLKKLESSQ